MSRLDELIAEYCPDGVEYRKIGELANYEQPGKYIVESTNYDDSYDTPVLTAGQSFILGYTNETEGIYEASSDNPVIIFDDFTGAFKWVDFPFKVKSSAMKMLTANEDITSLRYIYHLMGFLNYTSDEHKRLWISIYSELQVPVPPIEVQSEIVRILDNFTELTARKKQYEYYRDQLLNFGKIGGVESDIHWYLLRELVDFRNGKGHEQDIVDDGDYIVVNSKFISTNGVVRKYTNRQICPLYVDDILMVMSDLPNGKALAKCYLVEENDRYSLNQRIGAFHVKAEGLLTRFLFYILDRNKQLLVYDNGADQTNLKKDDILGISIPVPPVSIQKRIVYILDNFDAICSDLNIGLPAEIDARRKQYEYYRDLLLSFDSSQFVNVERERERESRSAAQ